MKASITIAMLAIALASCTARPLPSGSAMPAPSAYALGAGDKIRITTFGFKEFTGEFAVAADNSITFPLLGPIPVRGTTPSQLEERLATALGAGGFVRHPQVTAEVVEYRPYYILGEVGKPGQYPFTNGLTVLKAVATAQGFTYRANVKVIFITRDDDRVETPVRLTPSTPVRPGDTVRIAERYL